MVEVEGGGMRFSALARMRPLVSYDFASDFITPAIGPVDRLLPVLFIIRKIIRLFPKRRNHNML